MLTIIALIGGLLQVPAQATSASVITADESEATLKASIANNTIDSLMKGMPVEGGQVSVAMVYRTKEETEALSHEHVTEIYSIIEGSGTLITGGTLQNPAARDLSRIGAGITHNGVHIGGTARKIGPKDIVIVPSGMAHRFSQLDGPIKYVVYRFEPSQKK